MTPVQLGAHNLPGDVLIDIATAEHRVIVTENASDFARATTCTVLLVRKQRWPRQSLAHRASAAINCWAAEVGQPARRVYWLPPELR